MKGRHDVRVEFVRTELVVVEFVHLARTTGAARGPSKSQHRWACTNLCHIRVLDSLYR